MKLTLAAVIVLLVTPFAIQPAAANPFCTQAPAVDLGTIYVDVRHVNDEYSLYSVWVFAESNGIPGLQRGGAQFALEAAGQSDLAYDLGETDRECKGYYAVPDAVVI